MRIYKSLISEILLRITDYLLVRATTYYYSLLLLLLLLLLIAYCITIHSSSLYGVFIISVVCYFALCWALP